MADVLPVADASFDRGVLASPTPVLIDFWAPWCAPCRAIAPVVEEIAREYAGKLKVMKMNVDDNPKTPSRYGVRGIPNLILFQGGQVKEQIVGAVPKSQLLKAISSVVAERGRRWREQRGRRLRFSRAGRARWPGHARAPAARPPGRGPGAH